MAHYINVLDGLPPAALSTRAVTIARRWAHIHRSSSECRLHNHFDCDHDERPPMGYIAGGMPVDTAAYLDGWRMVVAIDADDSNVLIELLETRGARCDYDRGVRDALLVAYGE